MKFKGIIPHGYELVKGRYGEYLRKVAGPKPVNKILTRNSSKIPVVNRIAGAVVKGIAPERKYFYDGTLYNRLKSLLLLGSEQPQRWWSTDWLRGFEINKLHDVGSLAGLESSYSFTRNVVTISLEKIVLFELTKRKSKTYTAMRFHAVALFINEDKGTYKRFESAPQIADKRTKNILLEINCSPKPKLPFILFLYGEGMNGSIPVESADATGMEVVGSGVGIKIRD